MDKQNYTLRDIEKQALKSYYPRLKKDLAKELEAKLFKRKRVLKSVEQLLQGIYLYFAEQLSFQRVSDIMACQYDITMSDTAWRKQFLKAAPILYEAVERLLMQEEGVAPDMHNGVLGCESAYAIDATELTEQGGKTTEMRIHTLFSITGHKCTSSKITDQHVGESLTHFKLHKDALYFADRAYGKTPQLAYALEHQSNFVIRIAPHMVKFFTRPDCREKIMFPRLMQGTSFSTVGYFKRDKDKFYVRLIGAKLPEEKQQAAEKRVRQKAIRNQRTASPQALEAAKWMILVTTLPDTVSDAEIVHAYRLRWQIELFFKRSKTFLNFRKIRRSACDYKKSIVTLWVAFSLLISSLQLFILRLTDFAISDFNSYSLAKVFFVKLPSMGCRPSEKVFLILKDLHCIPTFQKTVGNFPYRQKRMQRRRPLASLPMHALCFLLVPPRKKRYNNPVVAPLMRLCMGALITLTQGWCVDAHQPAMTFFIVGETPPIISKL